MAETSYIQTLSNTDRLRARIVTNRGDVEKFTLQYEMLHNDEWLCVVRYDTAHGYVHRDSYRLDGSRSTIRMPIQDFQIACTLYADDLSVRWKTYGEEFLRGGQG